MSEEAKNKTRVMIGGREYSIISDEKTDYIQKIAIELDSRIKELKDAYFSLSALDVSTLAALNIMDDYTHAAEELKNIQEEVEGLRRALRDMQLKTAREEDAYDDLKKENELLRAQNELLTSKEKKFKKAYNE